jgi:hypothetical protein
MGGPIDVKGGLRQCPVMVRRCSQGFTMVAFNRLSPRATRGQRGTQMGTIGAHTNQRSVGHDEVPHGGDGDQLHGNLKPTGYGGREGLAEGGLDA